MTLLWAIRASRHVGPGLKMRAKFVAVALRHRDLSNKLAGVEEGSSLGRLLAEWPQTVSILIAPYQCSAWEANTRLSRLQAHLDAVRRIPGLDLGLNEKLVLADLSEFSRGASLIIDRSHWLAREGHLTLSLFKNEFRAFTIAFSLSNYPKTEMFIGGLQGRNDPDALGLYRELTKAFHGARPRDFILEAARLFALKIGVKRLYAVADHQKISRHRYFGKRGAPGLFYDDVWQERGGIRAENNYYELPLSGSRREIEDISQKKRSMYRRRYEMFDKISAAMEKDLADAERRTFEAT